MARRIKRPTPKDSDPLWYKDAVIYELHIKAFQDSNEDGIGDFRGLIQRLDYLQHLGVTAIWLLPFYPSPLRDDGYDIARYTEIHPAYGNLSDFKVFLEEAHRRGLRVITELVLNHTSDQHPWFQKSRAAKPGSAWRKFYVWSDTPDKYQDARIIFKDFEASNWSWDPVAKAYYWHRFYSHQPDLNFDNPRVHSALIAVIDHWFDLGVDGVRLDAVPYLYEREETNCENLPETHAFLKKLRAHVDRKYQDRMLLAEANQWSEDALEYFGDGDECHMAFNFPVMPRMFMALQMEDRFPIVEMFDPPLDIPENCQWALFLRNHDELTLEMVTDEERDYMYRMYAEDPRAKINVGIRRRLAPLLGNSRRRIELMNTLLFSLPGAPVLYYGDEIGMGDNYYLGDRDGVRTPMQWSPDRNAGFSRANPHKLYLPVVIDPEYHYEAVNVETQDRNLSTLLWWMRRMIATRKRYKAFSRGTMEFLGPRNHRVLAFVRRHEDEVILIIVNLSRFSQCVELDLGAYDGMIPREVFSQNDFPPVRKVTPYAVTLGPHDHYWFVLQPAPEAVTAMDVPLPAVRISSLPMDELESGLRHQLEHQILPPYLRRVRWFGGKGRVIRSLTVDEAARLPGDSFPIYLLLVNVDYTEGLPEVYQVPVGFAHGEAAEELRRDYPHAVLADFLGLAQEGVLFDAVFHEGFRQLLFDLILRRRRTKGQRGEILPTRARRFREELAGRSLPLPSRVLGAEQSNTSVLYDESHVLKLYRRVEEGVNPDAEIGRALTEQAKFPFVPAYKGGLSYHRPKGKVHELAIVQEYVQNQGDAWTCFIDHVSRYLDAALSHGTEFDASPKACRLRLDAGGCPECEALRPFVGEFQTELVELLGRRTAQMHQALASISSAPDFAPEGFSLLYQRSVFQSMRNQARAVLRSLEQSAGQFEGEAKVDAEFIRASQSEIFSRLRRIVGRKILAQKIRIHGDYHLGQVLFTGKDFVIMDFEGEPARPLWERRLKRSPLRDVAGMVRSFDYVIHTGLRQHPSLRPEDLPLLGPWVHGWFHYTASHFLSAYLMEVEGTLLLPKKAEDANTLFEAFILDKAIYELGYELNNRPDWAAIPMRGINHILQNIDNK